MKIALIPSGEAWVLTSMPLCWLHQISEPVGGTETCDSQEDHKVSFVLFPVALELRIMLIYFFSKIISLQMWPFLKKLKAAFNFRLEITYK